jgi:hypothetical protein
VQGTPRAAHAARLPLEESIMFARVIPRRSSFAFCMLAGCFIPALAQAQAAELKPVRIEYEYYPTAGVHGLGGPDSEARFQAARVSLALPTPVADSATLLIPGLRYSLLDVGQATPSGAPAQSVEALHAFMLSLGVLQPLDDRFCLFAQIGGGLAGNLSSEVASDDWVISAQALGMWTLSDGFTLGAGLGYDRRTGDVRPLPLVAFDWQPEPDLLVRGILPQFLALRYRAGTPVTLAVEASLDGERYHLSQSDVGVAHGEVAHSIAKLGPSVTVHWTDWFHTRVAGGAVLDRRFELFIDDASRGDLDVNRSPYAGIELWFGPSGWSADAAETAMAAVSREASREGSREGPREGSSEGAQEAPDAGD